MHGLRNFCLGKKKLFSYFLFTPEGLQGEQGWDCQVGEEWGEDVRPWDSHMFEYQLLPDMYWLSLICCRDGCQLVLAHSPEEKASRLGGDIWIFTFNINFRSMSSIFIAVRFGIRLFWATWSVFDRINFVVKDYPKGSLFFQKNNEIGSRKGLHFIENRVLNIVWLHWWWLGWGQDCPSSRGPDTRKADILKTLGSTRVLKELIGGSTRLVIESLKQIGTRVQARYNFKTLSFRH